MRCWVAVGGESADPGHPALTFSAKHEPNSTAVRTIGVVRVAAWFAPLFSGRMPLSFGQSASSS